MATRSTVINNLTSKATASPAKFLATLSNWATSPANQFMWVVTFKLGAKNPNRHFPIALDTKIIRDLEFSEREDDWNLAKDAAYFSGNKTHVHAGGSMEGCMLVQGINLPGEQVGHQYVGVQDRGGILPVLYGAERLEPQEMTLSVYEGNTSFVDTIIRQWIVLAGHLGQVSRSRDDPKNIKCDITVTQFAKTVGRDVSREIAGQYVPDASPWWQRDALGRTKGGVIPTNTKLIPLEGTDENLSGLVARKQMHFFNACPVRMEASDLTYSDDAGTLTKNVTWAYTHYTVHNLLGDGAGWETSQVLDRFYQTGIRAHWSMINALYNEKFIALGTKFPLGARSKRPSTNVYDKIPSNTMGTDNSLTIKELKERWLKNTMRHAVNAGINGAPGTRGILLYGPRGHGYGKSFSSPGATFKERWTSIQAKNLCKGARDPKMPGGFANLCKPPPPPPGSALDKIRNALKSLGKLARNARGFASAFKRVGKAKGVRGKLGALGDLNKSFKTLGGGDRSGKGPAKRKDGTTLGGGMPKAKSPGKTTTRISGALGVVDDAKKAARAITGKSRAKGGH